MLKTIRAGYSYRTRAGVVVGPIEMLQDAWLGARSVPWTIYEVFGFHDNNQSNIGHRTWYPDGRMTLLRETPFDLVEELPRAPNPIILTALRWYIEDRRNCARVDPHSNHISEALKAEQLLKELSQ
jgi:hypothetical protein